MTANLHGTQPSNADVAAKLQMLERRCMREKSARQQAEAFLEAKSLELYAANEELQRVNQSLEKTVSEKTSDLQVALKEVKEAQRRTEHLALHDSLTALPNRRYLRVHLDKVFDEARVSGEHIAILHIDLDRFKLINDTLGHAVGDHVLTCVGKILSEVAGEKDFVARIGGDEFVLVTTFTGEPEMVNRLARQIPVMVAKPIAYKERELRIGASVGFSFGKADETAPDKLLINSDIALYQAKDNGRGGAQEFTSELEIIMATKKQLADEILVALEQEQFLPFYQPKMCVRRNKIQGVEALVRWNHPERGLLTPDKFLDVASDIGALAEIDDMVLRAAMKDYRTWQEKGLNIPRFSVNISLGRLKNENLLERLDLLNLPRDVVGFEVLESVFFDNPDEATIERIEAIKQRGINIEIDDFGTGHASIIGLVKLKPDTLKIDRQLIFDIVDNPVQQQLVQAIVDIGRSLDLIVVAEGVESDKHAEICAKLGCDVLQGYSIGKPMPEEELEAFSRKYS